MFSRRPLPAKAFVKQEAHALASSFAGLLNISGTVTIGTPGYRRPVSKTLPGSRARLYGRSPTGLCGSSSTCGLLWVWIQLSHSRDITRRYLSLRGVNVTSRRWPSVTSLRTLYGGIHDEHRVLRERSACASFRPIPPIVHHDLREDLTYASDIGRSSTHRLLTELGSKLLE